MEIRERTNLWFAMDTLHGQIMVINELWNASAIFLEKETSLGFKTLMNSRLPER